MERRLIVMRHAKSSWRDASLGDHSRPLNARGQRDAPKVARHLTSLGWVPDRVLSSDAERTRQTWALMDEVWGHTIESEFHPDLYLSGPRQVEGALCGQPDDLHTVLILGHNPGWESVVEWLSSRYTTMTTANAALLSIQSGSWQEALDLAGHWALHAIVRPKEI